MSTPVLESVEFRGQKLSEWLQEMYVEPRGFMITRDQWDPQGLQMLITDIASKLNRAYECLSISKAEWSGARRTHKRKFNELLEEAVARSGGRAQVTALKAGVEARMAQELDHEALLENVKEFWELQVERLQRMADNGRQLAYLQSAKSRLE